MNEFNQISTLQSKVATWSRKNFGAQRYLYPLMGIVEEHGEFYEGANTAEKLDAICDSVIFLMDAMARYGLDIGKALQSWRNYPSTVNTLKHRTPYVALIIYQGRIFRSVLKAEQNIRQKEDHKQNLEIAVAGFYMALEGMLRTNVAFGSQEDPSLIDEVNKVFLKVVAKRDWTVETGVNNG